MPPPEPGSSGAGPPAHRSCRRRSETTQAAPATTTSTLRWARTGTSVPPTLTSARFNPRTDLVSAEDRLRHRLLRRGIPFGPQSTSTPQDPGDDDGVERGLLFLAYMTSIVDQFEFVMRSWANRADFHRNDAGADALLDQSKGWIVPTGGGYYFAPSKSALREVLST